MKILMQEPSLIRKVEQSRLSSDSAYSLYVDFFFFLRVESGSFFFFFWIIFNHLILNFGQIHIHYWSACQR